MNRTLEQREMLYQQVKLYPNLLVRPLEKRLTLNKNAFLLFFAEVNLLLFLDQAGTFF